MKPLHALALAGLVALSATALLAAESPALCDNLKPLARSLGHWNYVYKDLKGREYPGTLSIQVACGGNAVISRDQSTYKGKVSFNSISLICWNPRTQSIESLYVDSMGNHIRSSLQKPGEIEVWQGIGCDAKGVHYTGMATVKYQGTDAFETLTSHVIGNGKEMPQEPPLLCRRAASPPAHAAQPAKPKSKLRAHVPGLGRWSYHWTEPDGSVNNYLETRTVVAGGAAILLEGVPVEANVDPSKAYCSINYYRPDVKSMASFGVGSDGVFFISGITTAKAGKLYHQSQTYDRQGVFGTCLETEEMQGRDTMLYQLTHNLRGGEVKPDEPLTKLIMQRVP